MGDEAREEKKPRILIVDDEEGVRNLLVEMVKRFGYDAASAGGGEEALVRVREEPFDLVITDILMPDLSGLELIERIHETFPAIDLIAITGDEMRYKYTDVIKVGASDFITKPVDVNELQAKILRVFRERALRRELERLSSRDALTDLYNRRHFNQRGLEEVARALRQGYPLHLILMDIDRFKWYNDEFGHQEGDALLCRLAEEIQSSVRSDVDMSFRYGGDEFGVLLPHVATREAEIVAERLRRQYREKVDRKTSLSLGVAPLVDSGKSREEGLKLLIRHADQALYESKRKGGNRVTVYSGKDEK